MRLVVMRWLGIVSLVRLNQKEDRAVRTFPLEGIGSGRTQSKAETLSVATMRSSSPKS
ncbi:hypothetical protein ES703_57974 [subsurface metagenome]